ncbi:ribonuclease J [Bacillus thermotolerans]|uniref:Ribonuclease J n=1 Tax=Bacillus thermotolerans TaxID=1221996 RepID=A0A0F5I0T7_BACTR|nr:ribonuclease J [Bacillus thermotolerans]KKB38920.1 Ribonuclease J2 (endoribonuclease in RNA processing) [Bacillus thermotolerans]KKB42413.1 Ribonuclease J2 (endoribonuclease in RNA processing) [Bacillus thermotolerans]
MGKKKNELIKVIPLGGVGEIGKNMTVIEVDEEIFIIDSGLMFPENEMLGIDIVIPDISYLVENKDRIKGIFLTHGHEDAIGSLGYILRQVKAPVYGTKLTLALAKMRLREENVREEVKYYTVHSNSRLRFDGVEVTFFRTTHSIPDSVGVAIHTSEGAIVHTGEFKFDQAATGAYEPDIGKMAQLGKEGVFLLLSDSTEAERPGYTTSEEVIARQLSDAFHSAKGRIIVASFASNLIRVQQVFDAAYENGRKIATSGKSIQRVNDIAMKLGYLTVQEDVLISLQDIHKYPEDEVVILTTGLQGEPIEALQKMAKGANKHVKIKEGDTVLITATPSPGLEVLMAKTVDLLARAGANVLTGSRKVHVSGHGSQEDLKLMLNLMKPRYFIPIQGEYRMLTSHAKLAAKVGIPEEHIFIPEKGDVIEYKNGKMQMSAKVPAGNVLIDGIGVGDVGNIVLRDRKLLSQDGIFIVVITLSKKHRRIVSGPEIISRGFVYVRESEKLMEQSTTLITNTVEKNMAGESFDWSSIKQDIKDQLNSFLFEKTKRRPMILPIIMEV